MASVIPRRVPYVCKACRSARPAASFQRQFSSTTQNPSTLREQLADKEAGRPARPLTRKARVSAQGLGTAIERAPQPSKAKVATPLPHISPKSPQGVAQSIPQSEPRLEDLDPVQALKLVQQQALDVLDSKTVPADDRILSILGHAQHLARYLLQASTAASQTQPPASKPPTLSEQDSNRTLLGDLDASQVEPPSNIHEHQHSSKLPSLSRLQREDISTSLVKALYTLLEDPKIYISDPILTSYISTITSLGLPEYAPKIFYLYAHKPIPVPNSDPVRFKEPYSKAPKYAVPRSTIEMAMSSAISKRDMPLCMSIIDTTVSTPQFRAATFMSRGLLPLAGSASIIPLTWALSQRAAEWQTSWDPDTFFWMCMAGGGAYVGTMGTLLFITVTTWNDEHKRVRWVPGTPFTKRWLREDERYWFDRMALAWGYRDENKRGEEMGEEWEALREVLALRYMDLDRSSLLPGML